MENEIQIAILKTKLESIEATNKILIAIGTFNSASIVVAILSMVLNNG